MTRLHLTLACGDYDRTKTLQDGSLDPDGISLNYLPMQAEEIFWRMGHHQEFDASEMSLSNYITMTSRGESPFTAIPIFPSRYFRHSCVFINTDRGLDKPEDLRGKRIGVPEYSITAAVWIRGFLSDDHGVAASDVEWCTGGQEVPGRKERIELRLPPEIKVQPIPGDRTLNDMLDKGELDALVTARIPSCFVPGAPHIRRLPPELNLGSQITEVAQPPPHIRRLFPDFKSVEIDYYRRTRLFPIMHTVVIRNDVYEADPWVARSLYHAFCQSKDDAIARMNINNTMASTLPWLQAEIALLRDVFGEDWWPYGIEANRHVIEALTRYMGEQGLLADKIPTVEELFAPTLVGDYKL